MSGFTAKDVPDQTGRTILVTGANTGIGFEITRVLAGKGARVLLGCRSREKAEAAMDRIARKIPQADLKFIELDQADLSSVRRAAEEVSNEPRLDVLINNAGVMVPPRELTRDGFESQMGVNHFATFALTGLLLPKLEQTAGSRVVITSSIAHKGARIDFDDLNAEHSYKPMPRYQASKLANLLHMHELDRRLRKQNSPVMAVGCHPGVATTELMRHNSALVRTLFPLSSILLNTSAEGAWPGLMAATASGIDGGEYFGPKRRLETAGPAVRVRASSRSRNPELCRKLWDLSVKLTGVDPGI